MERLSDRSVGADKPRPGVGVGVEAVVLDEADSDTAAAEPSCLFRAG